MNIRWYRAAEVILAVSITILFTGAASGYVDSRYKALDISGKIDNHAESVYEFGRQDDPFDLDNENNTEPSGASTNNILFRNTRWNMTREDIRLVEGSLLTHENNTAMYYDEVDFCGYSAKVSYVFDDITKRLALGMYTLDDFSIPGNAYIGAYYDTVCRLTELYGKSDEASMWSINGASASVESLASGAVFYETTWSKGNVIIRCQMYAKNPGEKNPGIEIHIPFAYNR